MWLCHSGGTQRLARLVGIGKAKELIFTAKLVGGREAAEIGLVEHCVPQNSNGDAAYLKALEIAKQIADKVNNAIMHDIIFYGQHCRKWVTPDCQCIADLYILESLLLLKLPHDLLGFFFCCFFPVIIFAFVFLPIT